MIDLTLPTYEMFVCNTVSVLTLEILS